MFNLTKQPQKFMNFCQLLVNRNQKLLKAVKPCALFINSSHVKLYGNIQSRDLLLKYPHYTVIVSRKKSRAKKAKYASRKQNQDAESDDDDDDDDEVEEDEEYVEDGALVKTYNLTSSRIDLILKQVLKQKRRKIEEFFYNNKIRVNGKVLLKKALSANIGDEIDVVKGFSKNNPEFIEVSRIEILNIKTDDDDEKCYLKIKLFKSLEVDNYPDGDEWKEPEVKV